MKGGGHEEEQVFGGVACEGLATSERGCAHPRGDAKTQDQRSDLLCLAEAVRADGCGGDPAVGAAG